MDATETAERFRRWHPVAWRIAADVHPGRWSALGLGETAAARLIADGRSVRGLSRRLDWLFPGVESSWESWTEWPDDANGLATMSGGDLWRCALRLGACRHREAIAGLALKRDVAAFREVAGEDAHRFALRRAQLVCRDPDALGGDFPDAAPAENVVRAACLGLGARLAGLPASLAVRIRAKLPPSCDAALGEAASWPAGRAGGWIRLLDRVVGG